MRTYLVLGLLCLFTIVMFIYVSAKESQCNDRGGIYVRQAFSYTCILEDEK